MTATNMRSRRWWMPAAIAAVGLVLVACGTDDAGSTNGGEPGASQQVAPTDTAPPDESAPTEAQSAAMDQEAPTATPTPAPSDSASTDADEQEPAPADADDPASEPQEVEPVDLAPPLGTIDSWHNSEPLTLDQLRGSPVLLVFWADI